MNLARAAFLSLLVLAVPTAASAAVSTVGEGVNVRHVANVTHTERANSKQTNQGTDLELAVVGDRTFAFAGSYFDGLEIIDVTDPESPVMVGAYDCGIGQGDVQLLRREGRLYVAYAMDDGWGVHESQCIREARALGFNPSDDDGGTFIVDVTDPTAPTLRSFVAIPMRLDPVRGAVALGGAGSHNTTIHPSGMYLYNSNADLITSTQPAIEIVSLEDLDQPKVVAEFPLRTIPGLGTEAHDITFNADGTRAYVAALSHGEVLDTSDPAAPRSISTIVDPSLNVWHQAEAITLADPILGTRDFLIAEDEFAGAEHTGQCPNGAVHVYDITNLDAPVPVGVFNIDEVRPTNAKGTMLGRCTAHVFQIDHESKILTLGWYDAGVRVLDLSALAGIGVADRSPVGIRQLGYWRFNDTDAWAAKTLRADRGGFYLFANDKRRGFDVYRYDPPATRRAKRATRRTDGRWSTPAQAARRSKHGRSFERPTLAGLCFVAPR